MDINEAIKDMLPTQPITESEVDVEHLKRAFDLVEYTVQKAITAMKKIGLVGTSAWKQSDGTYSMNPVGYGLLINFEDDTVKNYVGKDMGSVADNLEKIEGIVDGMTTGDADYGPCIWIGEDDKNQYGDHIELSYSQALRGRCSGLFMYGEHDSTEDFSDLGDMIAKLKKVYVDGSSQSDQDLDDAVEDV